MIVNLLLILVCIVLSAFFSGSEIAYSAAQEMRLEHAAETKGGAYPLALRVKKRFEKALISILVGNNLVNIGASSLATVIAVGLMGEKGAWVATAIMTVLIITFGEISPKIIASAQPERFSAIAAVPMLHLPALGAGAGFRPGGHGGRPRNHHRDRGGRGRGGRGHGGPAAIGP